MPRGAARRAPPPPHTTPRAPRPSPTAGDLYSYDEATAAWRWLAVTFNGLSRKGDSDTVVLESPLYAHAPGWPVGPAPPEPTQNVTLKYRLHLPSYNGVTAVAVGVPSGATLVGDDSWNVSAAVNYIG